MPIPNNGIIIWTGTNASIPAGFTRETSLDSKFTKGSAASTEANVTGGADTHYHDSDAHGHSMNSHSHVVTTNYSGGDGNDSDSGGSELNANHYHTDSISGVVGGDLSSVASTYASVSNNPPYYEVIFIKSVGYNLFPDDGVAFFSSADIPSGFANCDGAGGTTNLANKYLRGAATSGNAGGTGGSTQNIHDLTHTHSESYHYHSQWLRASGNVSGGGRRGSGTGGRAGLNHYHYYYLNNNTAGSISTAQLTTTETVEPAYKKLLAIQNTSGTSKAQPKGLIIMWLGSLASIPAGWLLCDGTNDTQDMRGMHLKVASSTGEIGNTGGSNTHTHASQSHSHTGASHSHSNGNTPSSHLRHDLNGDSGSNGVGGGWEVMNKDRYHSSVDSIGSSTVSWASASTSANSSNNEPSYRTVQFIQFSREFHAGGMLLTFV